MKEPEDIKKIKRGKLYNEYLHDVIIPLAQIRKMCSVCENYRLCKMNGKIDALIEKTSVIMTKISQTDI